MSNHSKQRGFFIKGDVSGIQEFIFNVKSEKAARVLNARSAYIQLYTRIVKQYLSKELEKIGTVTLFSEGGGSFFLYLENSQHSLADIKAIVKNAEIEANQKAMIDDLYMVISVVEYADKEKFGDRKSEALETIETEGDEKEKKEEIGYWAGITKASNKDKLLKFASIGDEGEIDNSENDYPFAPYVHEHEQHDWTKFAHEFAKRGIREITLSSIEAQHAKVFETKLESLISTFQMGERMSADIKNQIQDNFYKGKIQNKLPEWREDLMKAYEKEIKREVEKRKINARYLNEDEQDEEIQRNSIIDYSFLAYFAGERTGTEKLGILKMDVDSLGLLFQYQTNRTEAERVSKEIKSFFEERLYEMLQRNIKHDYDTEHREVNPDKYRDNIYTVFAGGDDCFFVGGWDTILDWAALVRKDFKTYVTEKNIIHPTTEKIPTISAGIAIVGAKFPVIRFAKLAESAIDKAKASNRRGPKNKICLFDQVLTWNEYIKARRWAKELKTLIENDEKKSTLEQIKRSAIGFEKLQEKAIDGKISAPKVANLFYYIRRNINEKNIETLEKIVEEYKDALLEAFVKNCQRFSSTEEKSKGEPEDYVVKTNPMLLPISARIAEFLTRKNTKSDKNGKG